MVNYFLSYATDGGKKEPNSKQELEETLAKATLAAEVESSGRGFGNVGSKDSLVAAWLLLNEEFFLHVDVEKVQEEVRRLRESCPGL